MDDQDRAALVLAYGGVVPDSAERHQRVRALRDAGVFKVWSIRRIARELGVSPRTVTDDLAAINAEDRAAGTFTAAKDRRRAAWLAEKRRDKLATLSSQLASPPVPDSDKQVRHRTGRDDHLELGIPVPPEPEQVPVFPVWTRRA